MSYEEQLAARVRAHLGGDVSEKRMFGTLAFMRDGSMACAVAGDGLMVRVGAERVAEALAKPHTRPARMGERPMKGWIVVEREGLDDLEDWLP